MAEETKEKTEKKKPIYKYGEHELDLGNYIHNLGTNLNRYLDTRKDWSEGLRLEFTAAFDKYLNGLKEQFNTGEERFTTTNYGRIIDSTGALNNTDDDDIDPVGSEYYYNDKGEQISTDDYNKLKKRKLKNYKTFSANREVATYFKNIGEKLKEKQVAAKETPATAFDFGTDSFSAWHGKQYNPTGGEFDYQAILDLDKFENGARSTKLRLGALAADLRKFASGLDPKKDYSKTSFGSHEALLRHYNSLADRISDADGLTEQDYLDFSKAGISRNFLTPYTYTGEKLLTKQEQTAADTQKKAEEEAAKRKLQEEDYSNMVNERLKIYQANKGNYGEKDPYALGTLSYWSPTNGWDQAGFDSSFSIENAPQYYDASGKFTGIDKYINDYLTGENVFTPEGRRALSAIVGAGRHEVIDSGVHAGKYYIPQTSDRTTNRGLVYDPKTGGLQYAFIGDIPSLMNRIKQEWMEEQGIVNRSDRYKLFKEGGTIDIMLLGGGFSMDSWMNDNREKELKERATKEGRTVELQKAGERKTNSDAKDPGNLDAEWKATDTARVASSIADIGAMISSFLPGAGTAVSAGLGIGSSLTTFGADWAEDGLDWGDVGNLGANLGLDVLGLIPGGGAASKGAKIAKTLGKYASRAMAAVAAYQGLTNADGIIKSINKMTTDIGNMTVDDWRNVSQGFGLLTGGVAAGTRKVKKSIAEADMKAKAKGAVAVEMVDKNNPANKKVVAFDGNDAKAIREALKSGDLKKLREVTVGKYEQFRDWDLATTGNVGFRSVKGDNGWQMPWGAKEGRARIFDMYGKNGKLYTDGGKWNADHEIAKPIDSATELLTATVDKAVEVNKKALMDKLKNISERKAKQVASMTDNITNTNKAFTTEITLKLNDLNAANTSGDPTQITNATNALNDALGRQQDWLARRAKIQKAIDDIKAGKIKAYDKWKAANLQGTGKDAVLVVPSNPYNRPASQLAFEQILKDLNLKPNYFTYAKGGRLERVARFQSGGNTPLKNVVNPGSWYGNMFNTPEMKKWLETFNATDPNSIKLFNDLLDSWAVNKLNTGYTGQYAIKDKTGGVGTRLKQWNEITGTNPVFERIEGLARHGGSTDNPEGGYVDNIFGSLENFRHGGTKESWANNQEELQATIKAFADKGLDYYLADNGMYKLRVKEAPNEEKASEKTPVTTPGNDTSDGTDPVVNQGGGKEAGSGQGYKNSLLGRVGNAFNGPIPYRFARMFVTDQYNDEMTDIMKNAEIPIYKNWAEHKDTVESDLLGEMRGTKSKAELLSKARNMLTSDIDKYMAANLEATRVGLDMENEAKYKSDLVAREDKERAEINKYQDRVVATEAGNVNRAAGISTIANLAKHDAANVSMKGANIAKGLAQFEQEAAIKQQENKAAQDALIRSDIHNSMLNKALTDGVSMGLTMELVELMKLLKGGKAMSSFNDDQKAAVRAAMDIITEEETAEWAKHKGLSRYNKLIPFLNKLGEETPTVETFFKWDQGSYAGNHKDGGKIAIAGIKARTADAERFLKMILLSMKSLDKAMDRLAKSMVNYVKDIMK